MTNYYAPTGGLPPQTDLLTGRAVFTTAYAVIPKGVMTDIVTSNLPFWDKTRAWVLARPLSGFAETFSQYIMEVAAGGGSMRPETDKAAQGVIFVVKGGFTLTITGQDHAMRPAAMAICLRAATGRSATAPMHPRRSTGSAKPIARSMALLRQRLSSPTRMQRPPSPCPTPTALGPRPVS